MNRGKIILVLADTASFALSFITSAALRQSDTLIFGFPNVHYSIVQYALVLAIGLLSLLYVFSCYGLFRIGQVERSARIFRVIRALITWAFILAIIDFVFKYDFSRIIFFSTIVGTAILVLTTRYIIFRIRKAKFNGRRPDIFILGQGEEANKIEDRLVFDFPRANIRKLSTEDSGTKQLLERSVSSDIFVADSGLAKDKLLSILATPSFRHHRFKLAINPFGVAASIINGHDYDQDPFICVYYPPSRIYLFSKRLFDFVLSVLLMILIMPFLVIIAVCIRLDSEGKSLIRQIRIGQYGKPFVLWKFRTMQSGVPLYAYAPKFEQDSRVTRLGKVLRHFSLDELPQLWNIILGEMSFVGPRPEMPFIVKKYSEWQRLRLTAKPGLTGLWQIIGRKDIPLHQNLEYDFYYLANRSFFLDTVILLKTLPAVVFARGAY